MSSQTDRILDSIRALQEELEAELRRRSAHFRYQLENGRVVFEQGVRARHRAFRVRMGTFLSRARPLVLITAPVIYAMIVPFVILDLFVTIYQRVCFPVYGIERVNRGDFIRIDRHHLAYLNAVQKLNCVYCGYANGLIGYVQEIAGRTEAYWCPIKHAARIGAHHAYYAQFVDYGDAEGFADGLAESRRRITRPGLSGHRAGG